MIHYVTGGARSGKSRFAINLALSLSDRPVYVATARKWDDNFQQRIDRHVQDRDERWITYEEECYPSRLDLKNQIVVVDCVTLWLTNLFVDYEQDIDLVLNTFQKEMNALQQLNATLIIISNELGMGLHADTEAGRRFTDLQGWANQHVAQLADQATLMVSGISLTLKSTI